MFIQKDKRSILAKILCGVLKLRIETGRYINEKREVRICKNCNTQTIEDEYHFIFICPAYNMIRLYSKIDFAHVNITHLVKENTFPFCNFLCDAWKLCNSKTLTE